MIRTVVHCGCSAHIATYEKDDGKKEVTEREAAGECPSCTANGGRYCLPAIPPLPFVPFSKREVPQKKKKEALKKDAAPAQVEFKRIERQKRLKKREDTIRALEALVAAECQEEPRKKGRGPKLYIVPAVDSNEDGQPEITVSLPQRRPSREGQVRARADGMRR